MPHRRPHLLALLLLTVIVAAGYANSLSNGFVVDDHSLTVENRMIKDWRNLPRLVTTAYFPESAQFSYRPLVTLTYFMDYAVWGLHPFGYHLTSVLLHLLAVWGVYAVFARLLAAPQAAWIGAALFAVHPVLTEAVDNVANRTEMLAASLVLLALWIFLRPAVSPTSRGFTVLGLTAYGLACLAKETAVVLPLLLVLIDWAQGRLTRDGWRTRRPLYAGVALVTVGYLVVRFFIMSNPLEHALPALPLADRLRFWPYATWTHLRLLVWPISLSNHYAIPTPAAITDPLILFPLALLVCVGLGLAWLLIHGQRLAGLGLVWVVVALAPVSNVVPNFSPPIAERYLYLPAVGFSLLLTLAFMRVWRLRRPSLGLGLAGALLLTYGALTIERNPVWRDNFTLSSDTVEKVPHSPWPHNDLGASYEERGELIQAVREYAWATSLAPGFFTAYENAGRAYLKQGRLDLAAQQLQHAVRLNPQKAVPLARLGLVYHHQGRLEHAIRMYRASLTEYPRNGEVWANLGAAWAATGRRAEAVAALEAARRLNPSEAVIHHNLGNLYVEAGRLEEAVQAYRTALRINPNLTGSQESLAAVYTRLVHQATDTPRSR